jgi:RNA polymerase sigma factor (sigma-70 family)
MDVEQASAPSFAAFSRAARPGLVRFATTLVGSAHAGADIAQDALEQLWRKWDRVRLYDSPDDWLRRVARNLAITRARRLALERRRLPAVATREGVATDWPEPDPDLWRAVRRLPERQRAAVVLHVLEGRPHAEIAAVLGCSDVNARQLLHRGLTKLRTLVGDRLREVAR